MDVPSLLLLEKVMKNIASSFCSNILPKMGVKKFCQKVFAVLPRCNF